MEIGPFELSQLLILMLMVSFIALVVVGVVWLVERTGGNKGVGCGCVLAAGAVFLVCFALLMVVMANNW